MISLNRKGRVLYTASEAAELLGISVRTFYRIRRRVQELTGQVIESRKHRHVRGTRYYDWDAVMQIANIVCPPITRYRRYMDDQIRQNLPLAHGRGPQEEGCRGTDATPEKER